VFLFNSVKFIHTDVLKWKSQVSAFKAAIERSPSKSVDIVVAAAGLVGHGFIDPDDEPPSLDKDPPEPLVDTININLTGVFYTTRLALHYFQLKGSDESTNPGKKSVILISSLAGYLELPWTADYQASKYGVRGIFKALRNNVSAMGVRMNLIAPWFIQTPMTKNVGPMLEERGVALAKQETAVEAVLRCATDDNISGKSSLLNVTEHELTELFVSHRPCYCSRSVGPHRPERRYWGFGRWNRDRALCGRRGQGLRADVTWYHLSVSSQVPFHFHIAEQQEMHITCSALANAMLCSITYSVKQGRGWAGGVGTLPYRLIWMSTPPWDGYSNTSTLHIDVQVVS